MKECFRDWNPSGESLERLKDINKIIARYDSLDIRLTLRQLYYQLVSSDIIKENTTRSYKKLGNILSNARLAGLIDWDIIEDRLRVPKRHPQFDDMNDLVKAAVDSYRLPRWSDQDYYVELWCEKDALSSVLEPITSDLHINLMINRGYSSQSAMYDSANRFINAVEDGKEVVVVYLGDLDPSGEDMVSDIRKRMAMFNASLEVYKLALTPEQVRKYNPPPNMAKTTDSRYVKFAAKHGDKSYEVDAIRPEVLQDLVRESIEQYMDRDKFNAWIKREEREKNKLKKLAEKI